MECSSKIKTIFIAASGSGGHLFPAVYIAEAFKELSPQTRIVGIGSGRPLEKKIFSDWGVPYEVVETVGIKNRGIKGVVQFIVSIPKSLWQTCRLFCRYKPDAVVGVGGYATVFPVLYAWCAGIPTWIHEAELKPGLANYFLSFFSNKISVAFEDAQLADRTRTVFTGHPVRKGLEQVIKKNLLPTPPKNLLVLGGSQGAKGLDEALPQIADFLKGHGLNVRHQCRKGSKDAVEGAYTTRGMKVNVTEFIDDMSAAYKWADIVVGRSGAGSVMELSVVNVPAILVPFPHAQGDHQTTNAQTLVRQGKALLVSEKASDFIPQLRQALSSLLCLETYNRMREKPSESRNLSAAESIANGVFCLIP